MSLRERLRALRPAASVTSSATSAATSAARTLGVEPVASHPRVNHIRTLRFGRDIELQSFPTDAGTALCAEKVYPLGHKQGRISLDQALAVSDLGWRRLLPLSGDRFPIERAVFLDLETTGLSRGTGTYAFLVGVGRFVEGDFRLRQFFMRDYDDEYPMLEALRAELAEAEAIVTFNGRSFDWPLLETRSTMNRLRLPRLPHLDLLYPARRLWRPIIGGCSLSELEGAVLGLERHDDVPGYLIPQLYFDFLQTGDATPLTGVLVHNRLDILSMAALVGYVGQAISSPRTLALDGQPLPGAELFTIGRWLLPDPEGIACLEEALCRGLPAELRRQCSRLLATTYRRNRRFDDAIAIWERLTEDDGMSPWAYIELAKHYEHRARDLRTAREWTMRALDLMLRRRTLAGASRSRIDGELTAIVHRLRRIERKLGI